MTERSFRHEALLLITAAIWGFAFVAQRAGMDHVGPFTFNAVRFALGSISLSPFLIVGRSRKSRTRRQLTSRRRKRTLLDPVLAGAILFAGASLQQVGIVHTTAGKAGFITGLYVIMVPVMGLLWRHRPGPRTWLGAGLAVAGLYLLSFTELFGITRGDLLVLVGALFWAAHVIAIGLISPRMNPITLACLQYATCSALSGVVAGVAEAVDIDGLARAAVPILYAGLLSAGVAYTLQVVAQRHVPSSKAAIIMSLEAVCAALGGWLILGESIPARGLVGCGLMLAGTAVSQLDVDAFHVDGPIGEVAPRRDDAATTIGTEPGSTECEHEPFQWSRREPNVESHREKGGSTSHQIGRRGRRRGHGRPQRATELSGDASSGPTTTH